MTTDLRARGNDALKNSDFKSALDLYEQAAQCASTPLDVAKARANAAAALMAMGLGQHLNDAVVACARAWAACESYERAKTRLESLFVRAGTLDGAVEGLRDSSEALAKGKLERLAAARALGNDKFKAGDREGAAEAYSEGLANGGSDVPGASLLFCNRAACKSASGKHEDALADANEALARCETYQKASLRKATALAALGKYAEADVVFTRLWEDLPGDVSLVASLNGCRAALKKPQVQAGCREVTEMAEYQRLTKTMKLVFVDFTATWCGPCKMIGPVFTSLATKYPAAHFIKVDVDAAQDIAGYERVSSMPTFAVYCEGRKAETFSGADGNRLSQLVAKYYSSLGL